MSNGSRKIAVDVMGADLGLREVLCGVKQALETYKDLPAIQLVGDRHQIEPLLSELGLSTHPIISIYHASEVIEMNEKPIQSIRQKKDSSMVRTIELVKSGEADVALSCGNTGALMAAGTIKLRPMQGIERPALSSVIPSKDHHFILLDVGANPDTTPIQLVHNAILGTNHCRVELGVERPKVGLLTIGTEEGKGTERIQEAHELLKKINGLINYTGLVEGYHLFNKDVDVVVCDGFVGNILIKACESMFHTLKDVIVEELIKNPVRKIGALLSRGAYDSIRDRFDPDKHGAAPFLGINGTVIKAHGSSNRNAIMSAIYSGVKILNHEMNEQIQLDVKEAERLINAADLACDLSEK